jgi:hypothetical protein
MKSMRLHLLNSIFSCREASSRLLLRTHLARVATIDFEGHCGRKPPLHLQPGLNVPKAARERETGQDEASGRSTIVCVLSTRSYTDT